MKFYNFLKKVTSYLKRKFLNQKVPSSFDAYNKNVRIDNSTVMLPGSEIGFNPCVIPEDRLYVTIGEKGIIKATFGFDTVEGEVIIGNNVHIGDAKFIARNKIEIGNDVTMAWDIFFYNHNSHSIYWEERKFDNVRCFEDYHKYEGNNVVTKDWSNVADAPIKVGDKVWIGFGTTILKGVTIGEGAVIGAKSVVTRNVEPWTVVGGNPAAVIKYLPEYKKS